MPNELWLARWREGRIGFDQARPHPALVDFWPRLEVARHQRVFVPLCGRSIDMRWLAGQGHQVLGIELSPHAINQFVAQVDEAADTVHRGVLSGVRQGAIEVVCGDYFHLDLDAASDIDAFYDRAALIALPPARRQRYAFHLAQLLAPGAVGLLITVEFADRDAHAGPPYHVSHEELGQLFDANFERDLLGTHLTERNERETVWRLIRKGPRVEEGQAAR